MLYSARSTRAYEQVEAELDALHELRADAETIAIARTAQRQLAATSQHRVPRPDLLVAACAQQPPGRRPPSRPPLRNAGARPLLHALCASKAEDRATDHRAGAVRLMCSGTTPQPVHPDDPHARHRVEIGVLGCRRGARAVAAIREWRIAEPSRSRRRALEIAALSGTAHARSQPDAHASPSTSWRITSYRRRRRAPLTTLSAPRLGWTSWRLTTDVGEEGFARAGRRFDGGEPTGRPSQGCGIFRSGRPATRERIK